MAVSIFACATLASEGEGDRDLPTAGIGPFRKLVQSEVFGVAPFVLQDNQLAYREPSAIATDGNAGVILFVGADEAMKDGGKTPVIARTRANDGRSFYGGAGDFTHTPTIVLRPTEPWEKGSVGSPSALAVGDTTYLYYACEGGIGLARSKDGFAFTKEPLPVFARDASAPPWETTQPKAPSVAHFPDGTFHLIYESGGVLGEAVSQDGLSFRRLDPDPSTPDVEPIMGPSLDVDPASLPKGVLPPFDTLRVGHPCIVPRVTVAGRLHVRVLYSGYRRSGADGSNVTSAVGFAARYGEYGFLIRNSTPVFSADRHEEAPALAEWERASMLYVHEDYSTTTTPSPIGIAAAFSPPSLTLPDPVAFSDSP